MRTDPVPCRNATDYEIERGKHLTWNDDAHCNPCKRILDLFATRGQQADPTEYAEWNTGVCAKCNGTGTLGGAVDAHPSVYGIPCPDCEGEKT